MEGAVLGYLDTVMTSLSPSIEQEVGMPFDAMG